MKVAIDVRTVGPQPAGIGQYTRSLVAALARRPVDSTDRLELDLLGDAGTDRTALPVGEGCRLHSLASGPLWHLAAQSRFRRLGSQVYHSPSSALVPLLLGRRAVVTVHDLVPALFPETSTLRTRLGHRLLKAAGRRVGALIAVSTTTRVDLDQLWNPRAEVVVVPEAPRDLPEPATREELAERFDLEGPFFLAVGTLEPRKNLGSLVEAYARFAARAVEPPKLVIAGAAGWGGAAERTRRAAESLGNRLRPLGFVDDADIASLYAHARALIHPARYEGFGLPPLEAMAAGTAVAASAAGALPEVLGGAALYFDPTDTAALARLLEHLASDDAAVRDLERSGRERAALFSWDRTADETLEVYRRVAGGAG